ncbi:hypothetical protein YC2023_034703 [Brassica napus]
MCLTRRRRRYGFKVAGENSRKENNKKRVQKSEGWGSNTNYRSQKDTWRNLEAS